MFLWHKLVLVLIIKDYHNVHTSTFVVRSIVGILIGQQAYMKKYGHLKLESIGQQVIKGKCKVLSGGVCLRGMGFSISEPIRCFY